MLAAPWPDRALSVDSESVRNAFSIKNMPLSDTVDELKKLIKTEQNPDFDDVIANKLTLWRATIRTVKQGSAITIDALDDRTGLYNPRTRLSRLFPESPDDNTYIVVQRPLQGNLRVDIKKIADKFFTPGSPVTNFLDAFVTGKQSLRELVGLIKSMASYVRPSGPPDPSIPDSVNVWLANVKNGLLGYVAASKDDIIKYYLANLISSKQAVPTRCPVALNDFMQQYVTLDLFKADFLPTIELLVHLVKSLSFEPSPFFSSSLQDPLLNGLRSTSESTRTSSIALFKQFAQQSKQEQDVLKVVTETTKLLTTGKLSSPDHHGIFYKCLGVTAATNSEAFSAKALQGLTTMAAKESNEGAVTFGIERHSLVPPNTEELTARLVELVRHLLDGVVKHGGPLVGPVAVETYLALGRCVSNRLESIREPLALATLRSLDVKEAPENWQDEPLEDLASRVLYRLRF
ncbi:translational activator of GCN4, partial [Mortierella antarctica]